MSVKFLKTFVLWCPVSFARAYGFKVGILLNALATSEFKTEPNTASSFPRGDDMYQMFDEDELVLTEEQAEYVKDLRVNRYMNSRTLARLFTRKFPEFVEKYELQDMADKAEVIKRFGPLPEEDMAEMTDWESGDQLLGADLCVAAMRFFCEKADDGWEL